MDAVGGMDFGVLKRPFTMITGRVEAARAQNL